MTGLNKRLLKQFASVFMIAMILILFGYIIFMVQMNPLKAHNDVNAQYEALIVEELNRFESDLLTGKLLIESELKGTMSINRINRLMTQIQNMNLIYENTHITFDEGETYMGNGKSPNRVYQEEVWYDSAKQELTYSEPVYDTQTKQDIVTLSLPVYKGDKQVAVLGVDVRLNAFISDMQYKLGKPIYLTYNNGQKEYSVDGLVLDRNSHNQLFTQAFQIGDTPYSIIVENSRMIFLLDEMIETLPSMSSSLLIIILFAIFGFTKYSHMIKRMETAFVYHLPMENYEDFNQLHDLQNRMIHKMDKLNHENGVFRKIYDSVSSDLLTYEELVKEQQEKIQKIQNETDALKSQFTRLANALPSMVWVSDPEDKLLFINDQMRQQYPHQSINHMDDLLDEYEVLKETLKRRNFDKIRVSLKHAYIEDELEAKTKRIINEDKLSAVIGQSNINSFETQMYKNYLKKSRELHFINEISKIINDNHTIEQTLQNVIDKVAFLGNYNSCTIRLLDDNQNLVLNALSGYSRNFVLKEKLPEMRTHMWEAFKNDTIVALNHMNDLHFDDDSVMPLLELGHSVIYFPLTNYDQKFGIMTVISDVDFSSDIMVLLESISINITISLEKLLLFDKLKANYFKTVEAFVTAAEIKAERYSGHSRRVAELCRMMAEKLFLSSTEVDEIFMTGLLHDVGKLAFNDDEFEIDNYGEHPDIGRKMVENVGLSEEILNGIEYHHMPYMSLNQEQAYYAQFVRLSNDFDLFVTNTLHPEAFFNAYELNSGTTYSPQLFKVLKNIVLEQDDALHAIYGDLD